MRLLKLMIVLPCLCAAASIPAYAQTHAPSASIGGVIGLNSIPTARMDDAGTVRFGVSTLDPYLHAFIGAQLWDPLYVQLRQSAEISTISPQAHQVYPGIDFKFRLTEEGRYQPAMVLGMNAAFGHKRHASEYISLSKRFWDFDVTTGVGWGRMAGDGHLRNPMRRLSKHFDTKRDFSAHDPNTISDWFTGPDIGFFAGVEYNTPIENLSIKADWGAQDFTPERTLIPDYRSPAPWAVSFNYNPVDWASVSVGTMGGDKIFARLSLQNALTHWPMTHSRIDAPPALSFSREGEARPDQMKDSAQKHGIALYNTRVDGTRAHGQLAMDHFLPPALQIGRAVRHMANHAGPDVASFEITPRVHGLRGKTVRVGRRDVETAAAQGNGSPEEIWQDVSFVDTPDTAASQIHFGLHWPRLIWENDLSLSEKDTGYLFRTSMIAHQTVDLPFGFALNGALRWNMADNLERLNDYRMPRITPVRSTIDDFAARTMALDRAYLSWFQTPFTDVHVKLSGGLMEEMYAAYGGEILYRPFGKTFALGAEAWHARQRDPDNRFGYDTINKLNFNTAFLNAWYEIPDTDVTLFAKAGQFLGEDIGASIGAALRFDNGASLSGYLTATDRDEPDAFGEKAHLHAGVRFSLPIGSMKYMPRGSEVRLRSGPIGRDSAQTLDVPDTLYDLTEPMSYRRLNRSWTEVLN